MNHPRNMKICAHCGKIIIITGSCQDYLYKRGSLYYCGYNHWRIAGAEAPPKKKDTYYKSQMNWRSKNG